MPVLYRIDKTNAMIRTTCEGNVTFAEVVDHFKILIQDPDCPARLDVLLDLSSTTSIPGPLQLRAVSDQIGLIHQRVAFGACAIVATREVLYGMLRMFEVFAGRWFQGIRVCRTLDEARNWLNSQEKAARSGC